MKTLVHVGLVVGIVLSGCSMTPEEVVKPASAIEEDEWVNAYLTSLFQDRRGWGPGQAEQERWKREQQMAAWWRSLSKGDQDLRLDAWWASLTSEERQRIESWVVNRESKAKDMSAQAIQKSFEDWIAANRKRGASVIREPEEAGYSTGRRGFNYENVAMLGKGADRGDMEETAVVRLFGPPDGIENLTCGSSTPNPWPCKKYTYGPRLFVHNGIIFSFSDSRQKWVVNHYYIERMD